MSKNKQKNKFIRILTIFLFFLMAAMASYFIVRFVIPHDTNGDETEIVQTVENSTNPKNEEIPSTNDWVVSAEKPRYMTINKLDIINARVVELGTKGDDNQLEDPENIHDAGWYRESALPGAPFDTTYAGLYDGHNTGVNQRGIFFDLGRLVVGDRVTIERGDGILFNYVVREVETPSLEEINMEKMQKSFDPKIEGLNIITCGGNWDATRQTYTHRVTVRATLQN